jgi:predicted DNA-binding antitoxin AbrB/MazE fold protein
MISSHYGQTKENCFKIAISYLKDYLLWYPKLKLKLPEGEQNKIKIESLLETLQKFKGLNDNETDLITLYTEEYNSFYQDFNFWLNTLDPLAIQKTSWFIATVMYSLNNYGEKKGVKNSEKLYRGIKMNLTDLLNYERAENEIICYPSFTSTTPDIDVANFFKSDGILPNQYATLIKINYKQEDGFIPTAIDVSEISKIKNEKERLFPPYSFFRIKKVKIEHSNQTGNIELDSIGRKEILEKKLKDGYQISYNEKGFMEIIKTI